MTASPQILTNFIGGEWTTEKPDTKNINPSNTDDVIAMSPMSSADDANGAVDAAQASFYDWARTTPQTRSNSLRQIGDEILARKDEIGEMLSREEGKTLTEGIGETMRAAQIFHYFAGECMRLSGDLIASIRPKIEIEVRREPLGVVGIITPWNFPIAIPAWKIAPALAYGNTVVFKPAELTPSTAYLLSDIIARSGLPAGVFNLVFGSGVEVGQALVQSEKVAAISFTGSAAVGSQIATQCIQASPRKKVQIEMGGKNPLIVLDDADLDNAVSCAINGAFFSTGQRCTASSRIIATKGIYKLFLARLLEETKALRVGDALSPNTQVGPAASKMQLDQNHRYVESGKSEGANLQTGGERLSMDTPGYYFSPAIFTDVQPHMRVVQDEIFGPVACLQEAADYDHALDMANDSEFGLSAGICTTSMKYAKDFKRNAEAGMVMVNAPTAGVDYHVPFGGSKGSSYGPREQGRYAAEFFTTVKTAYVSI